MGVGGGVLLEVEGYIGSRFKKLCGFGSMILRRTCRVDVDAII